MSPSNKILLTGATGFLGRALVAEFVGRGVKPRCLVRKQSRTTEVDLAGMQKAVGDLDDVTTLAAALDGVDTVVHAAALVASSDPADNLRVNYEGTKNLIAACKECRVKRIVGVGTISSDIGRRGAYGDSKLMADNALLGSGLEVTLIRATLLFGPGSKQIDAIKRFLTMLPAVVPVIGDGKYLVQPVAVEDVAKVIVAAALEKPSKRFYYAAGSERITFDDMLGRMMNRLGVQKRLLHSPYFFVHTALSLAGKFIKKLPVNAAQVSTLCQDAVCSAEQTEKDFKMSFTPFDKILDKVLA